MTGSGPETVQQSDFEPVPQGSGPKRGPTKFTEILGTAAGSAKGSFQFIGESSRERIMIPNGIEHLPNVYAINIEGDSMYPEHKSGEVRFAVPSVTPQFGDTVVVEFQRDPESEPEAMIGHLIKRVPILKIGKINPEAIIEIDASSVIRLHRLATYDELAGRGFL